MKKRRDSSPPGSAMDWRAQVGGLKNRRSTSGPARPVYNEPMLKAEPVEEPVAVGERNLKPTSGVTISESLPPQYPTMHPELAPDPHVEHAQTEAQPSKIEESVKVARSDYESNEPMRVGGLLLSQTFDQIEEEGLLVTDKDPLDLRRDVQIKEYRERYQGVDTPIVDKIVSPGKPKSNDADDLANWFIDRLGLETYWMGKFWGRFSGGDNWGSHALGKAEGKTPYKIGYLFEEVPSERIEGDIQDINDLHPTITTSKLADPPDVLKKILQPHHKTLIIDQMKTRLNRKSRGHSNFFEADTRAGGPNEQFGFASLGSGKDPEHPAWVTVSNDLSEWSIEPLNPRLQKHRWAIDAKIPTPAHVEQAQTEQELKKAGESVKGSPCPVFDKFLRDSFAGNEAPDESIQCVYEFFGASLLGITHKFKRALYCYGETDTGKSVLAETFELIFPESARSQVTLAQLASEDNEKYKAELLNKRVNIVTETKEAKRNGKNFKMLGSAAFKQAVSGESFTGRRLYKDLITIVPRCAFVFCGNGKIPLGDQGGAVMNRFSVLHFRNTVPRERQDENLKHKIKLEAGGIIFKALEAVKGLKASRLIDPVDSQRLKRIWASLTSDTVTGWINDRVEKTNWGEIPQGKQKGYTTKAADVYRSYQSYCTEQKEAPLGKSLFWDKCRDVGIDTQRKNDGNRANVMLKDREN
tara:strand:- start:231 stop:2318 length:2088 start_codon:yes stop_codon:yes gene_type:complete